MAALPVASACGPSTSTSSPSRMAGSAEMTPGARMSPWGTKLSIRTRYTPGICFHPPNVGRRRPVPRVKREEVVFPAADHEIWEFPPHRHARGIDRHPELPRERPANGVLPDRSFSIEQSSKVPDRIPCGGSGAAALLHGDPGTVCCHPCRLQGSSLKMGNYPPERVFFQKICDNPCSERQLPRSQYPVTGIS